MAAQVKNGLQALAPAMAVEAEVRGLLPVALGVQAVAVMEAQDLATLMEWTVQQIQAVVAAVERLITLLAVAMVEVVS